MISSPRTLVFGGLVGGYHENSVHGRIVNDCRSRSRWRGRARRERSIDCQKSLQHQRTTLRDVETAARAIGLQVQVFNAGTSQEIHAAFAAMVRERPDALFLGSDPFFTGRRVQLATLSARHAIPLLSQAREIVEVGGLMSYGANIADAFRQTGVYVGRVLKGEKPADLPVVQSSRFELVINLTTAKALGLEVPATLLARADEVIE
jgi:putative tryptophan/tyrosine transport system substrate-binding protein